MITMDQLRRFTQGCLQLRQELQKGLRVSTSEYDLIKSHIQTLLADIQEHTPSDTHLDGTNVQKTKVAS